MRKLQDFSGPSASLRPLSLSAKHEYFIFLNIRLTSTLCVILCRKVRLRDVMHFIMVEIDRNLMTPVRAGSLLTVWSEVMPSEEVENEYSVFLILNT